VLRGLLLGIPVGLLAGWMLFEWGAVEVPRPRPPATPPAAPGPPPPPAPSVVPGKEDAGTGRDGGAPPQPSEVPDLIARIDAAREAKDWSAFTRLLGALARAGTGTAHDKLVQLMADPTLVFPDSNMHRAFAHWLGASDAPGIAAAARVRAETEYAQGRGPLQPGWLELVARCGDATDLQWLADMEKLRGGEDAVLEALAHAADRPDVERTLLRKFGERGRGWSEEVVGAIAARNGPLARRLITEGYERCRETERATFMGIYGGMADEANLADTSAWLKGLSDPSARLYAVYALQALHRRDLPLEGLEALVDEPARCLDEYARASAWPYLPAARVRALIEHNPVTWNARTLAALDAAIGTAPKVARGPLEQLRDKVRAAVKGADWNR